MQNLRYISLIGGPPGSVKMQPEQLSQVTEFKYMGRTLQSDECRSEEEDSLWMEQLVIKSMTELAGGELCLPQRSHN